MPHCPREDGSALAMQHASPGTPPPRGGRCSDSEETSSCFLADQPLQFFRSAVFGDLEDRSLDLGVVKEYP